MTGDPECRGEPLHIFYPDVGRGHDGTAYGTARTICARCPVQTECLLANLHDRDGFIGGLTPEQRRQFRRLLNGWTPKIRQPEPRERPRVPAPTPRAQPTAPGWATCDYCGQTFQPRRGQKYCSMGCGEASRRWAQQETA